MFKQLAILIILTSHLIYGMNCTEFNSFRQHNGHWYTITHDRLTFANAKAYAEANNGYLAIPNNAAENSFLASIMSRDAAWIGVYDPAFIQNQCNVDEGGCISNDIRFKTVKNTPLYYKNWKAGEPNNAVYNTDFLNGRALVSPTGEYWVILGAGGKWADVGNHIKGNAETVRFQALLEFDTMPSCATQPTDNTDPVDQIGAGGQAVCDTKIYNPELNITTPHKTFDCQVDESGASFCPYMLAECGQDWDFRQATSEEHTNTTQEYVDLLTQLEPVSPVGINFVKSWWFCDTCRYTSSMLTTMLPVIKQAGGTYLRLRVQQEDDGWGGYRNRYFATHDAKNTFYIRLNSGSQLAISPGTEFELLYKGFTNSNGSTIRAGGKPYVYFSTTTQCENLKLINRSKDNPQFYACIDSNNGDLTCPPNTTSSYIDGHLTCFSGNSIYYCPDGYTKNGNRCSKDIVYTYYEYLCSTTTNKYGDKFNPIDSGGDCGGTSLIDTNNDGIVDSCNSPTPPNNNCRREKYICQSDVNRPCVKVNNKMQCSPFPCFGQGDMEDLDTPTGIDDKNNDGWTEAGNCAGQIYIFNGQDNRCRSKMAFGIVDDCCNHDAFLFSLIECKDYEQILDRKKEDKRCHYVGDYCSDKVLGACVQKKKTFCCFNSKLARIIVEEGRKQLVDLDWGEAKHPNCRGFTPEEFEKIDFSRIDLTEFTDDIQSQINVSNIQNTADRLKDKINNMQGN